MLAFEAAQSINVNFADAGNTPSPSYAAAGAAGAWNTITGVAGPAYTLVGTDGAASGVAMTQSPTTTLLTGGGDPALHGDDATLLDHGLVTTGAETCLMFSGVEPGNYEVLIYAWTPNGPGVMSRTRQDEAPSTIDVGGAWTGAHVRALRSGGRCERHAAGTFGARGGAAERGAERDPDPSADERADDRRGHERRRGNDDGTRRRLRGRWRCPERRARARRARPDVTRSSLAACYSLAHGAASAHARRRCCGHRVPHHRHARAQGAGMGAGAFFVYGAAGWATKVIYEAIVQPRFGSPLPVFVGGGMIVAIVFAVIVRRKLRAR
jgi:hypothetical protein